MTDSAPIFPRADILCRPVELPRRLDELLDLLTGDDEPALLDSAAGATYGRYSLLACRPLEVLCVRDGELTDRTGRRIAPGAGAIWQVLARALRPIASTQPGAPPYGPGWIGYVGYEIGRLIERLPSRAVADTALPDLRLAFYDAVLVADTRTGNAWLVELKFGAPAPREAGAAAGRLRELLARGDARDRAGCPAPQAKPRGKPFDARSNFTPDQYRQAVGRCVEYIAAGDIFQVNLSQRFEIPDAPDARDVYRVLRRRNPACYAGYVEFAAGTRRCAVLSSSPELFLRVRGRSIVTRPIKGTRRRPGRPRADAAMRTDLVKSPKDNAELAMIVDLLRNDLGRVCQYGTIRVAEPATLEDHPTVFHLVATVTGELRPDVGAAELLQATFPGGSITGAPKIRAMEIIDELEGVARGVYTGCLGIVTACGDCEWNIAIRTIVYDGSRALIQAGGGIVADSSPQGEYEETLHKARALLEAVETARTSLAGGRIRV